MTICHNHATIWVVERLLFIHHSYVEDEDVIRYESFCASAKTTKINKSSFLQQIWLPYNRKIAVTLIVYSV